ncbi:hypothetical protein GCM10023093_29620 [Nemorincola caseinilytica]|uniref:DUF72 domain-containing protein n=1 Tax=Nemorincola caseinilytica TaxID=2054315 RepID=A0ABP8NR42_9BACT
MEFGKIPVQELEATDLHLRPEPASNASILHKGKGHTKFYIGCAKWGRKDWIGKLYPPGTKEKDFLRYYARQFNSIEFNGFYYKLYPPEQVLKWVEQVPKDFLFCPKFTESITHRQRLKGTEQEVTAFLEAITAFGHHLGPIFLMPHPGMGKKQFPVIADFINALPTDVKVFLELRHEDWYKDPDGYDKDLLFYLMQHKRGTVITDVAGRRDIVHMHLTTTECFIRFVGNALHPTDYTRIDEWVARIGLWMKQGLDTCYFFMHQHDELHSPELIKYFIEQMNRHNGTDIPLPVLYTQPGLF